MLELHKIQNSFAKSLLVSLVMLVSFSFHEALADSSESEDSFVVHVTDEGFAPQEIMISQGDMVTFENIGQNSHWPASNIHPTHRLYPNSDIQQCGSEKESVMFDSCRGLAPGEAYSFIFTEEGVWKFHDHIYPRFKGTVTVRQGESSVEESETEPKGFFARITESIKNLFGRLLAIIFPARDETRTASVVPDIPPREYEDSIEEDATEMFHDLDALYSYMRKFGPTKTTRHLHELQTQFGDCHQMAHNAGNYAYEIYGAAAFQLCSAECHSGCYHGATEAFFREHGTNNLQEDLQVICGSELNSFFSHQCIHGIGHGLMAWADYDIFEALENCDLLSDRQASCYTGVYMENIVGGLAQDEGHFTEYLNDDPHFPCTIVEEKYKAACYHYQTSRMVQLFNGDFAKVAATCAEAPQVYQVSCFQSMGRDIGGAQRGNPELAIAACSNAPKGNLREWCLMGAVQDSFWDPSGQDAALLFCRLLRDTGEKNACYDTIFFRAPQVLVSLKDREIFCTKAEYEYQKQCLEFF